MRFTSCSIFLVFLSSRRFSTLNQPKSNMTFSVELSPGGGRGILSQFTTSFSLINIVPPWSASEDSQPFNHAMEGYRYPVNCQHQTYLKNLNQVLVVQTKTGNGNSKERMLWCDISVPVPGLKNSKLTQTTASAKRLLNWLNTKHRTNFYYSLTFMK